MPRNEPSTVVCYAIEHTVVYLDTDDFARKVVERGTNVVSLFGQLSHVHLHALNARVHDF